MGLTDQQVEPGRKIKDQDGHVLIITGGPIGEFLPVSAEGEGATGVSGLLPRAVLTEADGEWSSVPLETDVPEAPAPTVKLKNADGATVDVDADSAATLKSNGWTVVE